LLRKEIGRLARSGRSHKKRLEESETFWGSAKNYGMQKEEEGNLLKTFSNSLVFAAQNGEV
jgi:hypothetical protein